MTLKGNYLSESNFILSYIFWKCDVYHDSLDKDKYLCVLMYSFGAHYILPIKGIQINFCCVLVWTLMGISTLSGQAFV